MPQLTEIQQGRNVTLWINAEQSALALSFLRGAWAAELGQNRES